VHEHVTTSSSAGTRRDSPLSSLVFVRGSSPRFYSYCIPPYLLPETQVPVRHDAKAELLAERGVAILKRRVEARRRWPSVSSCGSGRRHRDE
jgi:hypothetical protein